MVSLFARENRRVKRSVDLSPSSDVLLDAFRKLAEKRDVSLSRGAAIDAVLGAVLRVSPGQAARLYDAARKGLASSQDALDATSREDALSRQRAAEEVESWQRIAELFDILSNDYIEPAPMRSVKMLGQHLLVPDAPDWILVNEKDAACSTRATIVEVKNGARFEAPHFVYFDTGESSTRSIDAAILEIYPDYEKILAARVEPVRDAEGNLLNLDQLKEAPVPGYFPALPNDPVQGNPYGVVLVPEKGAGN